jgi:hypothetical protein
MQNFIFSELPKYFSEFISFLCFWKTRGKRKKKDFSFAGCFHPPPCTRHRRLLPGIQPLRRPGTLTTTPEPAPPAHASPRLRSAAPARTLPLLCDKLLTTKPSAALLATPSGIVAEQGVD